MRHQRSHGASGCENEITALRVTVCSSYVGAQLNRGFTHSTCTRSSGLSVEFVESPLLIGLPIFPMPQMARSALVMRINCERLVGRARTGSFHD